MCLALLSSLASLAFAQHASAQVPAYLPPEPTALPPAEASLVEPVEPAPEPMPLPEPPAPPPAPSGAETPAPAKTRVISEPAQTGEARGDDDNEPEPKPRHVWYGWQTLIADGVSLGTFVVAAAADHSSSGNEMAGLSVAGYVFAPGIIHFVHRNPGRGFASMGIRIGMPLAGGILGASIASGCDGFLCEADGAAVGLLLGMGGAIAMDAAVFAYDDRKPRSARSAKAGPSISPIVSVLPGRAFFGVAGEL